jgi:gamma-glutamyltranspeptidase/glutathione hydrolase
VNPDLSRYIVNPGPKTPVIGLSAAVTTDSAIVTETMLKVLRRGGNAADAGIAGCLVQAAVEPFMTNHAGLVTFLYYEAKTGTVHQLDSQGAHPSGLAPFRPVPQGQGPYAAAIAPSALIPGFMPGLKAIHEKFGTRPWAELCEDAVEWAEQGHPVSTFEYSIYHSDEQFTTYFPEGRDFFMPKGYLPAVGEIAVPPGLAATLKGVRDHGPDYMMSGPWAEAFVKKANEMGWKIGLEHMTETPPRWIEPIRIRHHEYEIVTLGPPQAQGFIIGIAMGILKHLGVREMKPGSAEHFWAMGHALRQAARHWEYAQDEMVYGVPRDEVLDDAYHAHLAKLIRKSRPKVDLTEHIRLSGDAPVSSGMALYGGQPPAGKPRRVTTEPNPPVGSCEIAVVDRQGNWVQMMNTLQGSGIPGQVIGGVPMVGSHATFGHLQSAFDSTLVKGAKLRCVIGNTLVLKEGKPVFSAGTPGTPQLTLPQVLTYALDFKLDPYAAVDAPRQYAMSEARGLVIEDRLRPGVVEELHKLGIRVGVVSGYDYHLGSFSVIARDEKTGSLTAVADPRRCAVADGMGPGT